MILTVGTTIDFAAQDPELLIAGDAANENLGTDVVIGDLDGDGVDDLVIGAPWAAGSGGREFAGHVYIFFGGQDRPALVSGDDADVTIVGAALDQIGGGSDRLPGTIAIGDVNGDALNDLVLGIPDARNRAGEVRVIFGQSRRDWTAIPIIDLTTMPGDVVIDGADANDTLGTAVAVGDVNGDGAGDVFAGAPRADGSQNDRTSAGEVYIFFGRDSWPDTISAENGADARIIGAQRQDFLGSSLAPGQLGGSEMADLAMGAREAAGPNGDRAAAGQVHVIFGSMALAGIRDLSATPADWVVYGADSADRVGRHLAIGDVSGDGQPDLVIGVPDGDGPANRRQDAGEVAVLFGPKASGTTSDLADGADFLLYGPQGLTAQRPSGRLGDNIALADLNADGVMDVMAGSRQGDGFGDARPKAGEAYVILGGDLPASLDLGAEDADIAIYGRDSGDALGRVAAGNIDGVSSDDLALGASRADVTDGEVLVRAGEVYVVLRQAVQPSPTATATPTTPVPATATPTPTAVVTPTSFAYLPLIMRTVRRPARAGGGWHGQEAGQSGWHGQETGQSGWWVARSEGRAERLFSRYEQRRRDVQVISLS